ncbi:hypothetical protein CA13_02910 [Planctomycetes bacterium CA13]|uniref:Ice-binding protein C-terminal domain-containing protein n=1 Tax=Novipirellula herctigrandis TaxID=2527986 RepID=A0A5C5YV49_9BACT|nr:hypothetical protein CA13_02910 [Planctomycetes bacterium CA13]
MRTRRVSIAACAIMVSLLSFTTAKAAVTVTVDPGAAWQGFMNVSELDNTPVFSSGWGVPDLNATFNVDTLVLSPNTIGDPDPFWYIGGGAPGNPGNKIMDANLFVQVDDTFAGETVTFEGVVEANTFTTAHQASIFIRDFAPDFSSFTDTTIPLTLGAFSIDLAADPGVGRHVQYGFNVVGENVWVTDTAPFGSATISVPSAVPEPGSLGFLALAAVGLVTRRRRS